MDRASRGRDLARSLDEIDEQIGAPREQQPEEEVPTVLILNGLTRLGTGPFRSLGLMPLGENGAWQYYAMTGSAGRIALRALIGEYATPEVRWEHPTTWSSLLDNLEGVSLYGRQDRTDPTLDTTGPGTRTVDILLWPASNQDVADHRLAYVLDVLQDSDPSSRLVDARPPSLSVRAEVDRGTLDELLGLGVVERVRPPLRPVVTLADIVSAPRPGRPIAPAGEPIGVLDDLVASVGHPLLASVVRAQAEFPPSHTFSPPTQHGTQVSSLASYGNLDDLVISGRLPPDAPFPVAVARVLDNHNGITEVAGQPHVTFEQAVRWLVAEHGVRVITCSINYPTPQRAALPDPLTVAVDTLSRELGVVIIVSSGNRGQLGRNQHWLDDYPAYLHDPDADLAAPADAALAVTVGGLAHRDVPAGTGSSTATPHIAIAPRSAPSPFTRRGPSRGAGGINSWGSSKPEFTANAGNWAWDNHMKTLVTKDWGLGVLVAVPTQNGRFLGAAAGTSFAAPSVAHELARIATRYPTAGPNLLRAHLALSARHTPDHAGPKRSSDPLFSAYGTPDASRVLDSGGQRALLTYEGPIATGTAVVHRLPIPRAFVSGQRRHRTVRVSLAFDPPVRRTRREYIAGRMQVTLVYGMSAKDVLATYRQQPSMQDAEADPTLVRYDLPDVDHRPEMEPRPGRLLSNTLQRRDFDGGGWQERHMDCFLVVEHNHNPATEAQKQRYPIQTYALAVELADEANVNVDLHLAARQRLQAQIRA